MGAVSGGTVDGHGYAGTGSGCHDAGERKATEAARRRQASDAVVDALRGFAFREGGGFVVFGSYVTGAMRYDSDLDVLIDFPSERAGAAWHFIEEVCADHGIPPDIHDAGTCRPAFLERVRARGVTLP